MRTFAGETATSIHWPYLPGICEEQLLRALDPSQILRRALSQ